MTLAEPNSPPAAPATKPRLGVVVLTFCSQDVIVECLESLLGSHGVTPMIVVVDNASPDGTRQTIDDWASGRAPFDRPARSPLASAAPAAKPVALSTIDETEIGGPLAPVTLIRSSLNRGFAAGVNLGLRALAGQVDYLWILNPDCVVAPGTAQAYLDAAARSGPFSMMTGRTAYYEFPDRLQTTGGRIDRRTAVCHQRSYGAHVDSPAPGDFGPIEWVTGANMLVSAAFIQSAGLMREDYFLYYEEIDWAFRRGDLPIVYVPEALVFHHGGTVIGTGSIARRPSPFANYFNHRNRLRFARRHFAGRTAFAYGYGLAKAGQLVLKGAPKEAMAVLAGMFEWGPSSEVRDRIADPAAQQLAFGPVDP
jgi:hypothetical protein